MADPLMSILLPSRMSPSAPASPAGHRPKSASRSALRGTACAALAIALLLLALPLAAQTPLSVEARPAAGGGTTYSLPVQTMLAFAALSFLPAVLLLMTSFTRIVIVLSLMRQALGLQTTPPNQVIVGLSLFLTLFVMGPTLDRIYNEAYRPYSQQQLSFEAAIDRGSDPLRTFMMRQTRESDLGLFARIAKVDPKTEAAKMPMRVLIPAFVTSELKTAFLIGFLVFVPFLIVDLIVASVLMSMGMMMLSPVLVALPFKLMLFVLADGWTLLVGSLVASFG
jgi:flagellar biosynthetic protein FliP